MKLSDLKPGAIVHEWGRDGTVMRRPCSWAIEIVSVEPTTRIVWARWNHNPARAYAEKNWKKWRKQSRAEVRR